MALTSTTRASVPVTPSAKKTTVRRTNACRERAFERRHRALDVARDVARQSRVGRASGRALHATRLGGAFAAEPFEIAVFVVDVHHRRSERAVPRALRDQAVHLLGDASI